MSNTFGRIFRFTSFGESHGPGIGVVIDGCPSGLAIDLKSIQFDLDRRKPGTSHLASPRKEEDVPEVLSGLVNGITTGAPITFFIRNTDQRSQDYEHLEMVFRPSHADFTYFSKYGIRDKRGGGRSSARETAARVIAGSVAKQLLSAHQVQVEAWVHSVGTISLSSSPKVISFQSENELLVKCPDADVAKRMVEAITAAKGDGDSLGGIIACRIKNVPAGWGEPIYGKLEAQLASAMLSINATKGFEIGSGFLGTTLKGSKHNDEFVNSSGMIRTKTNHSGGVQGGISNGEDIEFRVAFKPTSTISKEQNTVNTEGEEVKLSAIGRHDPCVVPRAVPIVEAMAAVVLADLMLLNRSSKV